MTTTPSAGHRPPDRQGHEEQLLLIGDALLGVLPDGWRRVDLMVRMNVAVQDLELTVYLADASTPEVVPPDGLGPPFAALRQLLYEPGRGTWFAARVSLNPPGRIDITYNLDHDPKWSPPIPDSYWVRDLEAFPRDEGHLPYWLREKIDRAGRHREHTA